MGSRGRWWYSLFRRFTHFKRMKRFPTAQCLSLLTTTVLHKVRLGGRKSPCHPNSCAHFYYIPREIRLFFSQFYRDSSCYPCLKQPGNHAERRCEWVVERIKAPSCLFRTITNLFSFRSCGVSSKTHFAPIKSSKYIISPSNQRSSPPLTPITLSALPRSSSAGTSTI